MTKLLDKAIAKVKELPEERQDEVAELVINYVATNDVAPLTPEQIDGVKRTQAVMRRGEFASVERVHAFFARFGL